MATSFDYQEYLASREWALLKNKVRERSGGICERCHRAPHQATHHKTYARIGRELLEDLLGVCHPCHEWLSGKSDHDPASASPPPPPKPVDWWQKEDPPLRVYLAGKIAKNDWRHDIFRSLRRAVTVADLGEWNSWPNKYFNHGGVMITPPFVYPEIMYRNGLEYGGPYFVGCDHGCFHGPGEHGQANQPMSGHSGGGGLCVELGIGRREIVEACTSLIHMADAVFCWLDQPDAYGTIYELGYARAVFKPVFLAVSPDMARRGRDFWFAATDATATATAPDAVSAWDMFLESMRDHRIHPYRRERASA